MVDPKYGRRIGVAHRPDYGSNFNQKIQKERTPGRPIYTMPGSERLNVYNSSEEVNEFMGLLLNAGRNRHSNDRGDAGSDILTFQDICAKNAFGDCAVSSVLEMGIFDLKGPFLKEGDPPLLFLFDGLVFNAQKKATPPHFLLGKANEFACSPELPRAMLGLFYPQDRLMPGSSNVTARANMTCIDHVEAFQMIYEISDRDKWKKRNEDWETVLVDVLADNTDFGPLRVTLNAFRSRDDALRSSTSESSDVLFVALTFALLFAYSTSLNFSCDLYRSKSYPAIAGVLTSILGMISGMGMCSLCGIAFVPTALVCPFLVVGVGTDDMFVVINGYALAYMIDSARERCILSLKDTGLAISITTLTSLISFLIGINTEYLSIKNFCYFCGLGMFFGYIYVFTFFFAFHCLDAKREEENRACLFCVPQNERREARRQELRLEGVEFSAQADIDTFTLGALMVRRAEQDAVRRHALRLRQAQIEKATKSGVYARDGAKAWSDTQDTRESGSPDIEQIRQREEPKLMLCQDDKHAQLTILRPWKRMWRWTHVFRVFVWLLNQLRLISDKCLTNVALAAHKLGKERNLDPTPSNGILQFPQDVSYLPTGDPLVDILNHPHIPLYYTSLLTGEKKLFIPEPSGSVGKKWRRFLIEFYGPLLVHPISKITVLTVFSVFLVVSMYGCSQLESGLDLKDLAPKGSYLNRFDMTQEKYFSEYDFPVDIFFPEKMDWWRPEVQQSIRDLQSVMEVSGSGKLVTNPFIRMLDDPELAPMLQSANKELFENSLYQALSLEGGKYKQFEQNFVWEGTTLRSWKMQILPAAMKSSTERASWMTQIRSAVLLSLSCMNCCLFLNVREDCNQQKNNPVPLTVMAWNYMMTFYESDLQITSSITSNMIVAAITMLMVAMLTIPQLTAGLIVCLILGMIDVGIVGFMYFWDVKLNMVSMICLLLATGFSVDYTAHVCHTFVETQGQSRDQRVIEALVLMGNPVFHGATSTILGIFMLGFSSSYIFRVFFKMMAMVTVFALLHAVVFLPVFLSIVGDVYPASEHKKPSKNLPKAKEVLSAKAIEMTQATTDSLGSKNTTTASSLPQDIPSVGSSTRLAVTARPTTEEYPSKSFKSKKSVAGSDRSCSRHHHTNLPHVCHGSPTHGSYKLKPLVFNNDQDLEGRSALRRGFKKECGRSPHLNRKKHSFKNSCDQAKSKKLPNNYHESALSNYTGDRRRRLKDDERITIERNYFESECSQASTNQKRLEHRIPDVYIDEKDFDMTHSPASLSQVNGFPSTYEKPEGQRSRRIRRLREPRVLLNREGDGDWLDEEGYNQLQLHQSDENANKADACTGQCIGNVEISISDLVSPKRRVQSPAIQRKSVKVGNSKATSLRRFNKDDSRALASGVFDNSSFRLKNSN